MKKVGLIESTLASIIIEGSICLFSYGHLVADWKNTFGIHGTRVETIYTKSDTIYLGTQYGMFCSTDSGHIWNSISNENININTVSTIATNDSFLFANYKGTIYRSKDNGTTWELASSGLVSFFDVTKISVLKNSAIVGLSGDGIFRSTNNGTSWQRVTSGLTKNFESLLNLVSLNDTIYMSTEYGLYISTTDGISWIKRNSIEYIRNLLFFGDTLYFTTPNGVFRSYDYGVTWASINKNFGRDSLDAKPIVIINDELIVGCPTTEKVYKTKLDIINWRDVSGDLLGKRITTMKLYNRMILLGTEVGLYESTDNGESWIPNSMGINGSEINVIQNFGDTLYAGANTGLFVSVDKGLTWTKKSDGLESGSLHVWSVAKKNDTLYAGLGGQYYGGGVYRSFDNARTWSFVGLKDITIQSLLWKGDTLYACTYGAGVQVSFNGGNSWAPRNSGLYSAYAWTIIQVGNLLYLGTEGDVDFNHTGLYRSTNFGQTWQNISQGIGGAASITCMGQNSKYLFAKGVYRMSKDSSVWQKFPLQGVSGYNTYSMYSSDSVLYVSTSVGLFQSQNNGEVWKRIDDNLPELEVRSVTVYKDYVFAGTFGRSIFRRPLSEVLTSVKKEETTPKEFSLSQNYPNPFNPKTAITFSITKESYVTLKVYNVLGEEVRTLLSEEQPLGEHNIAFDALALPSGVYFYRITAGKLMATQKMVLLR